MHWINFDSSFWRRRGIDLVDGVNVVIVGVREQIGYTMRAENGRSFPNFSRDRQYFPIELLIFDKRYEVIASLRKPDSQLQEDDNIVMLDAKLFKGSVGIVVTPPPKRNMKCSIQHPVLHHHEQCAIKGIKG
jgi:hypothetical protein